MVNQNFYHMWQEKDNTLQAEFTFANFTQAFAFMTEVAFVAEAQAHHPNWTNVYNRVSFSLNTHDAGNTVTDKDRDLARAIDEIAQRYSS